MAKKKEKEKKPIGRPSTVTKEVLAKLEQGFKIGLTDEEACSYADIEIDALYRYERKNEDFRKQKKRWKQNPVAKAKNTIFKNLDDAKIAQWYLEKKCRKEFGNAMDVELNVNNKPDLSKLSPEVIKQLAEQSLKQEQ